MHKKRLIFSAFYAILNKTKGRRIYRCRQQIILRIDQYLFGKGTHYGYCTAIELPAHLDDGESKVMCSDANKSIALVGDFNNWDQDTHVMNRLEPMRGFMSCSFRGWKWDRFINMPSEPEKEKLVLKADPYGFQMEKRPNNASVVADISHFQWNDEK